MRHLRLAIAFTSFFTVFGLVETAVQAQVYDFGFYSGWYPYWFGGPAYQSSRVPTPPYFAIHPPVYYGTRVGMPYGNSPITRPPRPVIRVTQTPQETEVAPEGQWIENPFYQKQEQRKTRDRSRKQRVSAKAESPSIIENPYLVSNESPAKKRDAKD